jgi:hypothetical protein
MRIASRGGVAGARVAVITMVRDETFMLPRWVAHYGRQLGTQNLIVLDDNSVDGSTDDLPCTVYRLPPPPWNRQWATTRTQLVNGLARGLLACNDAVIFTDTDEFLVADPAKYASLSDYLSTRTQPQVVAPMALEVMHNARVEPPLVPDEPILGQRRFIKFSPGMCKPLVKRVAKPWRHSFHGIHEPFTIDTDLWMFHLKYADQDLLEVLAENRRMLHTREGRGHSGSFWPMGAARLKELLASWTETDAPDEVPEFRVGDVDCRDLVAKRAEGWWQSSAGQVKNIGQHPIRRLPARFHDVF